MRRLLAVAAVLLSSLPALSQSVNFNVTRLSHNLTVVGDFNNDGREDGIVFTATNGTTSGFHVQMSSATAAYSAGPSYTLPNGESMETYAVADFNNDGKLDLVIATGDSKLLVY